MARESWNNSIRIGGDARGPVTAGSHNRVDVRISSGSADPDLSRGLIEALDQVQRLIDAHASELTQPRLATRDVERLREEVQAEEPDIDAAHDTVNRLLGRVAAVGALAGAAVHLKDLIQALWPG